MRVTGSPAVDYFSLRVTVTCFTDMSCTCNVVGHAREKAQQYCKGGNIHRGVNHKAISTPWFLTCVWVCAGAYKGKRAYLRINDGKWLNRSKVRCWAEGEPRHVTLLKVFSHNALLFQVQTSTHFLFLRGFFLYEEEANQINAVCVCVCA